MRRDPKVEALIDAAEALWVGRYENRTGAMRRKEWCALLDALKALGRCDPCPTCKAPRRRRRS